MKELKTFTTGKGTYDSFPDKTAREAINGIPAGFRKPITGTVGQILEITEVDEDGNVTGVKAVDKPTGGGNDSGQNLNLTSPNGTVWRLAIRDDGTVYAVKASGGEDNGGNNEGEDGVAFIPFDFVQVSDTHYQYSQNATAVLVANINALDGVDFVTNSGDLTLENPAELAVKEAELAEVKANLIDPLNVPHYPCKGNHDTSATADLWRTYTGMEELHELNHKGCVFLFVDCQQSNWMDWLEEQAASNAGKRIFAFEHLNIEADDFTVGLREGETRGRFSDDTLRRILRLLRNNHNIIWFTGHTHWPFKTAVNDVYNADGLMGTIVHTPYLNAYQGWMVEVGEESTILRGVSFAEGGMTYLGEGYDYTIMQDTTDYGESEIIAEGGTVSVGGNADISVYLATQPKNNQIVSVVADNGISTAVTELVFTSANYATAQTVTVRGDTVGTGRLTLYSESKTTVRKVDVVAGSATVNYFNKNKPFVGSGNYRQSNLIPAMTGDTIRSTTLGSKTNNRLKVYDENANLIAEAENQVEAIDYRITEENVAYVTVVYRVADGDYADTLMVTVNQDLPSEYIAYNAEPVGYVLTNYADPYSPSLVDGYYSGGFVTREASGQNVSNLIPCVAGDVANSNNLPGTNKYLYVYNAERVMIARLDHSLTGTTITNENAAYFAVGYNNSATDLMIMKNQKVPGYYVADTDTM